MDILFLGTGAADFLPTLADQDRFTVDKNVCRCTSTLLDGKPLHLWCSEQLVLPEIDGVVQHTMQIGKQYMVDDFAVTALGANHLPGAVHYIVEKEEKSCFTVWTEHGC